MSITLLRLIQLENSASPGSVIVTDGSNVPQYLAPGTAGQGLYSDGAGNLAWANSLSVAAGSSNYLSFNETTRELSVSALAITDVTVDTAATLAAFIAASYTAGTEFQEGDTVILTTPGETYIHNGGSAVTAADFTQIEAPGLTDAYIRVLLSSGNAGIVYNAVTGVFTLKLSTTAGNDLAIDANGLFLDVSAANVTDTNNLVGGGAGSTVTLQAFLDVLNNISDGNAIGQIKYWNGTAWTNTTFTEEEDTGITGTSVTLGATPISTLPIAIYRNGQKLRVGAANDYTLAGTTLTMAIALVATDVIVFEYYV